MGALKQKNNIVVYERKKEVMSTQPSNSANNSNNFWGKLKEAASLLATILGVLVIIVTATVYVVSSITGQGKDIEDLYGKIDDLEINYDSLDIKLDNISSLAEANQKTFLELAAMNKEEAAYLVKMKDIYTIKTESVQNEEYLAQPLWQNETIIASDINGDTVYKAEDLYNTPIVTAYLEGKSEVYFYGRFNENNHWNGKCILNVYNADKLVSIFEGIYDDGELFSYERVSGDNSDNTWTVSDRVIQGQYNSGETWIYSKTEEFVKDFTMENVKEKQIITVDNFLASRNEKILSYYNGNTSNGLYNDKTGGAYLVKYKEDGDVDILYNGRFEKGVFQDGSGEAWFISWGNADDGYYYYTGNFNKGKHGNPPKNWQPMTQEEIESIVKPERYKCALTGLLEDPL